MTKLRNGLLLLMLLFPFTLKAQTESIPLSGTTWILEKDEMSGMGTHTALREKMTIRFLADGNWKSSAPILGITEGQWFTLQNGHSRLKLASGEIASIEEASNCCLKIIYKKGLSRFIWSWKKTGG